LSILEVFSEFSKYIIQKICQAKEEIWILEFEPLNLHEPTIFGCRRRMMAIVPTINKRSVMMIIPHSDKVGIEATTSTDPSLPKGSKGCPSGSVACQIT